MLLQELKNYIFSFKLLNKGRKNQKDFIRDRILTFPNLIVFMVNFMKKSLQLEIYNFTEKLSLSDVTKQAFSKARMKLLPITFQLLNQKFVTSYYSNNQVKTFKDLRILAIDGSTLRLPRDKKLYEYYGSNTENNGVSLARVSILFDVLNKITLDSNIDRYLSSEREMANNHIIELTEQDKIITQPCHQNDLLLFDRGYQSLFIMYYILHLNKHFLLRATENFLTEVAEEIKSGSSDTIISINAFAKGRKRSEDFKK